MKLSMGVFGPGHVLGVLHGWESASWSGDEGPLFIPGRALFDPAFERRFLGIGDGLV